MQCKVYNYLNKIGCFFLHPRCGTRREAADFALCVHVSHVSVCCLSSCFSMREGWQMMCAIDVRFSLHNLCVH